MPLDSLHVSTMPFLVGEVKFMSGTQTPAGFVKANGQLLSRTQYPLLWAYAQNSGVLALNDAVRTDGQYTVGDGSTTFRVPDYRGEFIRCLDEGKGKDAGRSAASLQDGQMPAHTHNTYASHPIGQGHGGGLPLVANYAPGPSSSTGGTTNNSENRPRNIALPALIFAGA